MPTKATKESNPELYFFSAERHVNVVCNTHIHPEAEIVVVTEGTLQMTIDGKTYQISKGFGVFIPPFTPHSFHSPQPNESHVLVFAKAFAPFFFDAIACQTPIRHIFAPNTATLELLDVLLPNDRSDPDRVCVQAVLALLCQNIYTQCTFSARKQPLDDSTALLLNYIAQHYTEELSLQTVAKAVGIHPVTVSKIFSRRAGVSFHFHLQYLRCTYAARLLQTHNMTVSEIAYEAGFGSTRSFNRAFREIYSKTPTQYRQAYR